MKERLSPSCKEKEDRRFSDNIPLLRRARAGDSDAEGALVALNGGLVNSIAARFLGRGTDYEDLVEIGNIGLLKAIRSFDEGRACAFSTYAVPLIFGEIRRFLRDDGLLKVSRTHKRLGAMLAAAREKCAAEGNYSPRLEDLARVCNVTVDEAAIALDPPQPPSSLSELLYDSEDGPSLESRLSSDEENERAFDRVAIAAALKKLPDTRRKIILLRYFRDYSQEETARALGLTQVKVSREEKKILAFLKEELS